MKVEVYFNLHRKVWSVRALEGRNKGRVIVHAERVILRDAKFVVQQAGRDKVVREQRKNIHAFVRGELEAVKGGEATRCVPSWMHPLLEECWTRDDGRYARQGAEHGRKVTYNPYRENTFVTVGAPGDTARTPIHDAPLVTMRARGVDVRAFDPCAMPE